MQPTNFLNPEQASAEYGIAVKQLDEAIQTADLPAARIGNARLIYRPDLENWIIGLRDAQQEARLKAVGR